MVRAVLTLAVAMAAAAAVPADTPVMVVGAVISILAIVQHRVPAAAAVAVLEAYDRAAVSLKVVMAVELVSLVKVQTVLLLVETPVKLAALVLVVVVLYLVPEAVVTFLMIPEDMGQSVLSFPAIPANFRRQKQETYK
jgi:hypothetical protein